MGIDRMKWKYLRYVMKNKNSKKSVETDNCKMVHDVLKARMPQRNGGIWQKGIFASHRRNTRQKIFCKKQESKQIQRLK